MTNIKQDILPWQLLREIQLSVDEETPLARKIQKLGELLLRELPFDALWCATQNPLSQVGCGVVATPLSSDPHAAVTVIDYYPNPAVNTLLKQVSQSGETLFFSPDHQPPLKIDGDMGDTLFSTLAVVPVAAIPLISGDSGLGGLVMGVTDHSANMPSENLQQLLRYVGIHLGHALRLHHLEGQHDAQLRALNRLSEILLTTTELPVIVDHIIKNLPRLLPGEVHGIIVQGNDGAHLGLSLPANFRQVDQVQQHMVQSFGELRNSGTVTMNATQIIYGPVHTVANWKPADSRSIPILHRKDVLGLLYVATDSPKQYGDEFLRLASLVVSQISAVMANAQLFGQVARERARLAAILASRTDAVLVVDRDRHIVLDNPAALDVLGAAESQRGRLLELATSREPLIRLFENALQGGSTTGEVPLPDGRTFFANLSPVQTDDGYNIGWVATMQDVSHFKELNDLKNKFVSTASHDLRSPLAGILIATRLIQDSHVTDDQQELLELIERRVKLITTLIDDLLDIGQIEAGIDLELVPSDIGNILVEAIDVLQPLANEKAITLTYDIGSNLPQINADKARLTQAIQNLVNNGINYTPAGGSVNVQVLEYQSEIWVQVIDSGIGIPVSNQPHVFEKFYRVQSQQVNEVKGTGLGLAIVKGIIEQHHGRIWLESAPGAGTTFTLALPIIRSN
jgi:PAS domain S-box-containing protein